MKKVIINYIGCSTCSPFYATQLENILDIQIRNIPDIIDLFQLIGDKDYSCDIIMIDIEKIFELKGTDAFSLIDTLSTIINCTTNCKIKPKLVASVDIYTNVLLIKQIMGTSISGIYPSGDEFTIDEKVLSITDIINGVFHVPKKIKYKISSCKKTQQKTIGLTPRQEQIISLIQDRGASNKVIAKTLNITESTVKLHVTHILKKYGVKNRTQLAVFSKN